MGKFCFPQELPVLLTVRGDLLLMESKHSYSLSLTYVNFVCFKYQMWILINALSVFYYVCHATCYARRILLFFYSSVLLLHCEMTSAPAVKHLTGLLLCKSM